MNVYTCTDHDGHWPVGVASVVVANDVVEATNLLAHALADVGLDLKAFTLTVLDLTHPHAVILNDGSY